VVVDEIRRPNVTRRARDDLAGRRCLDGRERKEGVGERTGESAHLNPRQQSPTPVERRLQNRRERRA
jgi:hypothetical protein